MIDCVEECGRVWKSVEECERVWKSMEDYGRVEECVQEYASVYALVSEDVHVNMCLCKRVFFVCLSVCVYALPETVKI